MTGTMLDRARAGDETAFADLVEPHRREIQAHCYRILGSLQDAEDLLQETMLAAWRGLGGYEERASLRVWLYRIATNRCLNAIRARDRRPEQRTTVPDLPVPTRLAEPMWLEPYPDALLDGIGDTRPGPEARYEATEAISLAFVTALQHLPPRQRCVLVLRDVLGFGGDEVAEILGTTPTAAKGALQRARATLRQRFDRPWAEPSTVGRDAEVLARFAAAVETADIAALVALLSEDAWLTMPPEPYEYQGPTAIGGFLRDRWVDRGVRLRLVATGANRQPAFACYTPDPDAAIARAYALVVLTVRSGKVTALTFFRDSAVLARFGMPRTRHDA